jgi:hypothetical protein
MLPAPIPLSQPRTAAGPAPTRYVVDSDHPDGVQGEFARLAPAGGQGRDRAPFRFLVQASGYDRASTPDGDVYLFFDDFHGDVAWTPTANTLSIRRIHPGESVVLDDGIMAETQQPAANSVTD